MSDLFEHTTPADAFDGKTYEPKRDYVRLKGQLLRVFVVMQGGKWKTLHDIKGDIMFFYDIADSEAAISARLRDLRKSKYGGHTVEREHVGNGLYRYRLIPRP